MCWLLWVEDVGVKHVLVLHIGGDRLTLYCTMIDAMICFWSLFNEVLLPQLLEDYCRQPWYLSTSFGIAESHLPKITPLLGVANLILNSRHGSMKYFSSTRHNAEGPILTPELSLELVKFAIGFAVQLNISLCCWPLFPSLPQVWIWRALLINTWHAQHLSAFFLGNSACDSCLCIVLSDLVWFGKSQEWVYVEHRRAGVGVVVEGDPGLHKIGSRDRQQNSFKAWLMVPVISYTGDIHKVCSNVEGDGSYPEAEGHVTWTKRPVGPWTWSQETIRWPISQQISLEHFFD